MIHIVYSTDDNYVFLMSTSMMSVIKNNTSKSSITFHILENKVSEFNKSEILKMVENYQDCKVIFYDFDKVDLCPEFFKKIRVTKSYYSRLFISEFLDDSIEKVIYLDCDTLVLNDIKIFWDIELEDYVFAGIKDVISKKFLDILEIPKEYKYINTGSMLINLRKYKSENFKSKILNLMETLQTDLPHFDQGIINKLFYKNFKIIQPKFNFITPLFLISSNGLKEIYNIEHFYSDEEILESKNEIVVAHLTQSFITRPWIKNSTHPLAKTFLETLKSTPFKNIELKTDNRILKVKIVSVLYKILPNVIFVKLVKLLN